MDPARLGYILVFVLGMIVLLAGAFLYIDGHRMRHATGMIEAQEAGAHPDAT